MSVNWNRSGRVSGRGSLLLSRVVIPLGQSYVLASYFSVWKRIVRTLVENVLIYCSLFVIFAILFVYLVVIKKVVAL